MKTPTRIVILVALALLAHGALADAHQRAQETPFDFRGIPLGITLDAFLSNRVTRAVPADSTPLCETDTAAGELGMAFKTKESLTVACRWAHRSATGWQVSRAVIVGSLAQDHVLRFVRAEGQSTFRLYEVSLVVDEITAADLRDALATKFGVPRIQAAAASAASSGARVYTWENAVSTITLCFLPMTHNGTLTYVLKEPDAWLKSVVRQWQASEADIG